MIWLLSILGLALALAGAVYWVCATDDLQPPTKEEQFWRNAEENGLMSPDSDA